MTLPQDVVTLLAATGVAETAYRDFTADYFSQTQAASHWRLLRQLAPRDASPVVPASATPHAAATMSAPNNGDTPRRSAVFSPATFDSQAPAGFRDDAFMVSSSDSEPTQAGNRERSLLAMAASTSEPAMVSGDSELASERKGTGPSRDQAGPAAEHRREGAFLRLSLRGQTSEPPRQEASLASVLQRVSS